MAWKGVFLGLLVLIDPSRLFDGLPDCPNIPMAVPAGGSGNISIPVPRSDSASSYFVQKFNTTTSSWQNVVLSFDDGSENFLSSFKETFSFSGGYFKVENVSKGAEGRYSILDDMDNFCVAVVNLTVLEPSTSHLEKEHRNETKGEETGSWILLVALPVALPVALLVVATLVIFLLYKCGFIKSRGKVCAYPQLLFSKMSHLSLSPDPSQPTGSSQDSQESEELTKLGCEKDRDRAQGTRDRNGDPAPQNGEGDLLTGARDLTQEPREMDPLAEDTGLGQGTKDGGEDPVSWRRRPSPGHWSRVANPPGLSWRLQELKIKF